MWATPSGRVPGRTARDPGFGWAQDGTGPANRRRAALGGVLALGLALAAVFVGARIGDLVTSGGPRGAPARAPGVTFGGVAYGLVGVNAAKRLPQRGGRALTASGMFEIVKLRLRAVDGRPHVISGDLLTLEAGATDYAASNPDDLGLTDRQWGAVTAATAVPAFGAVTVKVVFDVAPGALRVLRSLLVGPVRSIDPTPAAVLPLSPPAAHARHVFLAPLTPSPVLG